MKVAQTNGDPFPWLILTLNIDICNNKQIENDFGSKILNVGQVYLLLKSLPN